LLALKENQGNLYADVDSLFTTLAQNQETVPHHDYANTIETNHGRIEIRQAWTLSDPQLLANLRNFAKWPELHTLLKIQAERIIDDKHSLETRYFISSLHSSAAEMLTAARTHWQIENSCHWVLDIAFREDAHNFAILRHIAHNCLKQERSTRIGTKNKRLRAAWDNGYLLKVLSTLFL
jgi:predicted transposase YbfD/YdcC